MRWQLYVFLCEIEESKDGFSRGPIMTGQSPSRLRHGRFDRGGNQARSHAFEFPWVLDAGKGTELKK